jgi:hypothetical protein
VLISYSAILLYFTFDCKTAAKLNGAHLQEPKFKGKVPADYEDSFIKAYHTFRHQRVYDPETQTLVPLRYSLTP